MARQRILRSKQVSIGKYKAPQIELLPIKDFRGGLNLNADAFQLAEGESPDMLNVDCDPRGGFGMRKGVDTVNDTALGSVPKNIWAFNPSSQIIVQIGNDAAYSTGGGFTTINPDALTMTGTMRAATFDNLCYITRNAEQTSFSWDGSSVTVLSDAAGAFNDDLDTPAGGTFPKAKCVAAHRGYMWVAGTSETDGENRVRFSHPNEPEDWRTNDYIDVDKGVDGDSIVALVPFKDRLLVFKQQSVHAITGFSPDTFAAVAVSHEAGAISQEAVSASESAVYFFSWPNGVMRYDGAKLFSVFDRLRPLVSGEAIPSSQQSKITLAWMNRRLWLSVPYGVSATDNTRAYVWDPLLGEKGSGAWVAYDLALGPMMEWQPPGSAAVPLACSKIASNYRVFKLDQSARTSDTFDGTNDTQIESYYVTRWFDPTDPVQRKRWRRPEFTVDADESVTLVVEVFKDFEPTVVRRVFPISTTALPTLGVWGDDWGTLLWSPANSTGRQMLLRGLGIGNARAVQLRITGPSTSVAWGVNAIGFKFLPKRIR